MSYSPTGFATHTDHFPIIFRLLFQGFGLIVESMANGDHRSPATAGQVTVEAWLRCQSLIAGQRTPNAPRFAMKRLSLDSKGGSILHKPNPMQRALFLASLSLLGILSSAPAATRTWMGSVSTDFYNPANWSPNGIPVAGDTLNIATGSVAISPVFTNAGQINWTGGSIQGALFVATNGWLALSGTAAKYLDGPITNAGTLTLASGLCFDANNAQIVNQASGLVDVEGDYTIYPNSGWSGMQFINAGTFRKSAGANTCVMTGFPFYNTGSIQSLSGRVDLQSGGALAGTCAAAVAGAAVTFSGGSFTLASGAVFTGPGFVGVANGTPAISGTLATAMQWSGGSLGGNWSIAVSGSLTLSGAATKYLDGAITNAGTLTLASSLCFDANNAQIVNQASGLVEVQGDYTIYPSSGWPGMQIANAGTFRKSAGSGNLTLQIPFVNSGQLAIQSGALSLGTTLTLAPAGTVTGAVIVNNVAINGTLHGSLTWLSGTLYGQLLVANDAVLSLSGAATKYLAGTVTNAGTINVGSGLAFDGNSVQVVNQPGALVDLQGDYTIYPSTGWSGMQFINAGTFRKSAGTNTATVSGIPFLHTGNVAALSGTLEFQGGGTLAGTCTTTSGTAITFNGGSFGLLPSAVFNGAGFVGMTRGTISLSGTLATVMGWSGGEILGGWSIATNGLFALSGTAAKYLDGQITNAGTMTLASGLVYNASGVQIVNQAGALVDLQGDYTIYPSSGWSGMQFINAGTFRKSAGTNTCVVTGFPFYNTGSIQSLIGRVDLQSGGALAGTCTAAVAGAAVTFSGGSFTLASGAVFIGPGFVGVVNGTPAISGTLATAMQWSGGNLGGNWSIAASGSLTLSGATTKYLDGAITNAGTLTLASSLCFDANNAQIVNQASGLVEVQGDYTIYPSSGWPGMQIANAGTFRKSGGTNTAAVSGIPFLNTGTVESQRGLLTFDAAFTNAAGSLAARLNGDGDYGRIACSAPLTLNGPFSVSLLSGYTPALSNMFQLLTYPSVSGSFTSYNGLELGGGLKLTPKLDPTAFSLTVEGSSVLPPTILTQPASQTVTAGTNVTFSVTASGTPPLSYLWQFNGTNLANATNVTLTLTNVQLSQAGKYAVRITNAVGFVLSSNALLAVSPAPSNCVPAPAGMVAWWTGNNDASDVFGSSNGSLQAGAAIAAGLVGGAFDLPSGGYVSVPDNPALAPTNTITVETWIYQRSQLGANDPVVKKAGDAGTTSDGYSLEFAGTELVAFWVYVGSGGWQSTGSGPVAANRWTHLAGSYDGATLRLYVNGMLANSRAVTGTMTPSHNPLNIGGDPSTLSRHFDGLIDEVSIYNRALSGGEIASIYTVGAEGKCAGATPSTILTQPASQTVTAGTNVTFSVTASGTPPLSYLWRVNGTNLANATNPTLTLTNVQLGQAGNYSVLVSNAAGFILSSNALLTVSPAPSNCVPAPAGIVSWWSGNDSAADSVGTNNGVAMGGTAFAPGEVGEAFSFDGVSGWVDIPNPASLNPTGPFSVEAWIKANPQQLTAGGIFLIVDKSHGFTDGTGWLLQGNANGTVGFGYGTGGSSSGANFPEVNTLSSVLDNQWHHLAGVFTGTQLQIYLDGALQSTLNQTALPVNNQRDAEIGCSWGGGTPTRYFHGLIDEISYYDRGLSSNEVVAIYAAGSAGKCSVGPITQPGLRADYRFQNTLLSSVGNPPALSNLGSNAFVTATVDGLPRTVLTFGFNDGLLLQPGQSVIPSNVYSVVILAALEDVSYYRRLLGFQAIGTDEGWYVHNGRLSYWPVLDGSIEAVAAGQFVQFALTRAADGTVRGYMGGSAAIQFPDAIGSVGPGADGVLRFFADNTTYASAGQAARIRIYDVALTDAQVAALDRLPAAGPTLTLTRAGNTLTMAWPTNFADYRLRSAPSLAPPILWTTVSNVSVSGPLFQATVGATNNSRFFQLVNP